MTFPLLPYLSPLISQHRVLGQNVADGFIELFDMNSFKSFYDVDSFMQSFNSHCKSILNVVAPVKMKIASSKISFPWINEEIRCSRRLCRKVERLWKSTNLEVHRLHLKDLICSLNKIIRQARSAYFSKLISTNRKNPKVVFSTLDSLVSPCASKFPKLSQPDCSSFLQGFLAKVLDVGANIPPLASVQLSQSLQCPQSWSNFSPVTVEDVHSLLTWIKPSSCPLDTIPTSVFLKVFHSIGSTIVDLINLGTEAVPKFLKHALINPVLKKPNLDQSDPKNFRPISKLPFISKILEKVVAVQLNMYLEEHNISDSFQSGFKKNHSTETALLRVSNDVLMAADSGQYTVLVLLDLKSAFDTVDHNILIERLHNDYGLSGSVLNWFISYLSGRTFNVAVGSSSSEIREITCGVPQGSVLAPILFILYMIPLGKLINQFSHISYHLYADDIQLYCSFTENDYYKLQNLLNCLTSIKTWLNIGLGDMA
uniref:Reverse transcriptase domain-containing protein n=1 Tax=Oryzias latipes TaxID=8090 RepID=A0A3P9J3F2_ORYLA